MERLSVAIGLVALCAWPVSFQPSHSASASRVVTESFSSQVFANSRAIRVYLPPGYDETNAQYPVLYLNDGFTVFSARGWDAPNTLDRLVANHVIPPMLVVGIDNAAAIPGATTPDQDRTTEYLPYPDATEPDVKAPRGLQYPTFLVDEVMPMVTARWRVLRGPDHTAVGGSSYGAIAALVAVLHRPGVFGRLLLESPPIFLFDGKLVDEVREARDWPGTVSVGICSAETDDPKILDMGQRALDEFVAIQHQQWPRTRLSYNIVPGARHTSSAWRERLPTALRFLYGQGATQ